MDPAIGDLPVGDVLIEDDTIAAVDAEHRVTRTPRSIDATGCIVIPGFVDTHRHTWEAAIRGCAPNATLDDYFVEVLDTFAPRLPARGRVRQQPRRRAGVPQRRHHHAGRLVAHQQHPGAPRRRRSTACRSPASAPSTPTAARTLSLADYWFESKIVDSRRRRAPHPRHLLLLRRRPAHHGPGHPRSGLLQDDVVRGEWALARELGIPITVHVAMGRLAGRFGMVKQLSDLGLLGPDTTYIHCCYFSDEEWRLVADSGGTISIAAAGRDADGARLAAGDEGARRTGCGRACRSTSSPPCPATCSPRCGPRSAPSGPG